MKLIQRCVTSGHSVRDQEKTLRLVRLVIL